MVFETSVNRIRTFDGFSRAGSARWGIHEIIGQKPLLEFIGPGQEEISFSVRLDISLGVNPSEELEKLRKIRDTGTVNLLVVGGKAITTNYWLIESLKEEHKVFDGRGFLMSAIVEINLKEYHRLEVQ